MGYNDLFKVIFLPNLAYGLVNNFFSLLIFKKSVVLTHFYIPIFFYYLIIFWLDQDIDILREILQLLYQLNDFCELNVVFIEDKLLKGIFGQFYYFFGYDCYKTEYN